MKYGRAVTAAATRAGADMAPVFLGYKDLKRTLKLPACADVHCSAMGAAIDGCAHYGGNRNSGGSGSGSGDGPLAPAACVCGSGDGGALVATPDGHTPFLRRLDEELERLGAAFISYLMALTRSTHAVSAPPRRVSLSRHPPPTPPAVSAERRRGAPPRASSSPTAVNLASPRPATSRTRSPRPGSPQLASLRLVSPWLASPRRRTRAGAGMRPSGTAAADGSGDGRCGRDAASTTAPCTRVSSPPPPAAVAMGCATATAAAAVANSPAPEGGGGASAALITSTRGLSPLPQWASEPSRLAAVARHLAVAAAVNAKALAKIVKKHDKVTRSRAGAAYLDSRGGREELPWAMPALLAALEQAGRTAELLVLAGTVTVGSTVAASVAPTTGPVDDVALSGTVCDATGSPSSISPDDGSVVAHDATCAVCLELLVSPRRLQCGHIFCASCNASQLAAGDDRCALCRTPRAARTGVPAPELRAALTAAYPAAYACRRRALRREAAAAAARDNAYAARTAGG
ncbi:hypothetical protein MMPV_001445 [Pyropia vietnamensis]